jgi:hypothetical protein
MSYLGEAFSGFVIVAATIGGALIILPRAKPEAPTLPVVLDLPAQPVTRAEPLPQKSDAERVDDLQKELLAIAAEQKRLTNDIEAIQKSAAPRGGRPAERRP